MPQPLRRYDIIGPMPFNPELTRDYPLVPGDSPMHALYIIQFDGLGKGAVRFQDGRMVFANPHDRAWCAGRWIVKPLQTNGTEHALLIEIPPTDPGDGQKA